MKFTRKYQSGGSFGIYSSVLFGTPGVADVAPNSGATPTSETPKQNSIISEELYKELLKAGGNVLPNEWTRLATKIQSLEESSELPYLEQDNITKTLEVMGELNSLKRNKELWDTAYETAESNGSLNEIAISDSGSVYVKDRNGKVSTISINDYEKRKNRYQTMTISELLERRQFDNNFINNSTVFNVANNAVSINSISDYIQNVVKTLGTETTELTTTISREEGIQKVNLLRELSQTGRTPTGEEMKGLEILRQISEDPDEAEQILRFTPGDNIEINKKVETERNHALRAAKYIWSTLDRQSQNRLRIQGIENDTENPTEFILSMLAFGSDHSVSESYTPKKAVIDTGANSGSSASDPNLNNAQMMLKGTLKPKEGFTYNTMNEETKDMHGVLTASMAGVTSLVATDGQSMSSTTLDKFLVNGEWNQVIDQSSIYFGERRLPEYDLEDIALLEGNDLATVYLPSIKDSENRISVDFDKLEEYHAVMKEFKENGDAMSRGQIIQLFSNAGFIISLNENNEIQEVVGDGARIRPFLITEAYTRSSADIVDDNKRGERFGLRKQKGKRVKESLEKAFTTTSISGGKPKDQGPSGLLGFGKTPYVGYLFMPLRPGYDARISATTGVKDGPTTPQVTADHVSVQHRNTSGTGFNQTSASDIEY